MQILMKNINKSFGVNQVLCKAEIELKSGEVHALCGENGAGKSTLMKILTGVYTKDGGNIYVDGQEVSYRSPQEAEENGIVFIYQELNVMYDLTVEANLFMNKEIKNRFGLCDSKAMQKKASEALSALGVSISPTTVMNKLSVGQQQMIEICKALMADAKVMIMDEPTAALTEAETATLFRVIQDLKKKGVSIIYISHRMEEIFEICDRVTVMRDGEYMGTRDISNTNMDELIRMMIGRDLSNRFPERNVEIGETVFEIQGLTFGKVFQDISFKVHKGEVLGVAGLMGAGRTEIMQSVFGSVPFDSGKILVDGKEVKIKKPGDAISLGIGYITEDRKIEGLMLDKSIRENLGLANLESISGSGMIERPKEKKLCEEAIGKFDIKCFSEETKSGDLSGGNQQKVVLAKWILRNPRILILDEPTRGVDVGAKEEIYNIINELAGNGVAVLMISSELPELIGMSDRIIVIHEGHLSGELDRNELDEEKIMTLATGGSLGKN
ncbi:MAG: sugar ABC transporter ATP-binding protein [Lachnospiraceae bacterium]|nr:sugar ABC transporter ATP-binding protein [Lachnospiraceae bacterium]